MSISVVIPVGPFKSNTEWLQECLDSLAVQTMAPDEVVLIDDGANLLALEWLKAWPSEYSQWSRGSCDYLDREPLYTTSSVYTMPWRTGISHAFNYGVMLADTECVFMLGSDDTLEPTCLEACWEAYNNNQQKDGYYSVPIRYLDTGEVQTAPCNAAMVTKGFWRMSGGFPIETAIGIGDSTLLSICLAHHLPVYWVGEDVGQPETPLYNYRRHPDIHTYKLGPWWGIADQIRSKCTELWNKEEVEQWSGRY